MKTLLNPEDGYELWLRYAPITDAALLDSYRASLSRVVFAADTPVLKAARQELVTGLESLLGVAVLLTDTIMDGTLVVGTPRSNPAIGNLDLNSLGDEGYTVSSAMLNGQRCLIVTANEDVGVLYGVFHLLRHLQMNKLLDTLNVTSIPKTRFRMLNHWDNLDGTIERGYAGFSLWDWHKLPDYVSPRITDYARANASIGINAVVLTNPNANALILTRPYLKKAEALAAVLRPYGMRIYLSARFNAPMQIGGLTTADPLDADVATWWRAKADEIYSIIPDFGGFLVKANSEGQPGPHEYGRSHGDGANMLAAALAPHGGIVCWRAFVYNDKNLADRAKQAYDEFVPQDGTFSPNVFLQVKNGAIDFQPREPFHPLFGAMPKTPLMLEVQITQEYLGHGTHLAYLTPMYKETLDADTGCRGTGSFVSSVVDGSLDGHTLTGMAGVSNIGNDRNWCGHPFAAANWYAFGRLAWDHALTSEEIADEWLRMTFSNDVDFVGPAKELMMRSREAVVDYMTPLGLHHLMARSHHYGPGPWVDGGRPDWTSLYYHRADAEGIGFNRVSNGSDAVSQYCPPVCDLFANPATCPENLLLWFHHLPWGHVMQSGRTLWDELCIRYDRGVNEVRAMQRLWDSLTERVDAARFEHVRSLLAIQEKDARWWHDSCILYFQTFSGLPIPPEVEQPTESLEALMAITHYFVPGIPEGRFSHY